MHPSPARPAGRSARAPARVWVLSAALAAAAAVVWVLAGPGRPAIGGGNLPWPVVAGGIAATSLLTTTFTFRRSVAEVGLQEIPVLVGIVFLSPSGLVLAIATGYVLAGVVKRCPPARLALNAANGELGTALAYLVYRAVLDGGPPAGVAGWLAGGAAVVTVSAATVAGVSLAITVSTRRLPRRETVAGIRASAAGLPLTAVLAVAAVTMMDAQRLAVVLVIVLAGVAVVAQRGGNQLRSRHATLEQLYRFTEATRGVESTDRAVSAVLRQARDVMGAERIELTFAAGDQIVRYQLDTADQVRRDGGAVTGRLEGLVEAAGGSVLIPRSARDEELVAALAERGLRDAIATSISFGATGRGVLVVANRRGSHTFDEQHQRLFEALAAHGGMTVGGSRVLDQLRQEVAARQHEASHDGLTGLANRTLFADLVHHALVGRRMGEHVAVMLMDLDGFKDVNDTLGHHIGDGILREVAVRLGDVVEPAGRVARLGGDEFAIVVPTVTDVAQIGDVARQALRSLADPLRVEGLSLGLRASLGISVAPEHGEDSAVLLQRADVAMYGAKANGGGMAVYDAASDRNSTRRLLLTTELDRAVDAGEMELWYQPQANLRTGRIVGCEALLRWTHPMYGNISPTEFIPVAEQSGIIGKLTWWVLEEALRQLRAWHDHGLPLAVSVNVSARTLLDADMVDRLADLLSGAGVDARWLTLELTESSIINDPVRSERIISALGALGVQVAIDDFGTGYSSLSRLKVLPIHMVKVDKSFVLHMSSDAGDAAIVRATIELARNLGHTVVAEGVEDRATWDQLADLGCDSVQGFFLARPMPAASVEPWVRRRSGRPTLLHPVGRATGT